MSAGDRRAHYESLLGDLFRGAALGELRVEMTLSGGSRVAGLAMSEDDDQAETLQVVGCRVDTAAVVTCTVDAPV